MNWQLLVALPAGLVMQPCRVFGTDRKYRVGRPGVQRFEPRFDVEEFKF